MKDTLADRSGTMADSSGISKGLTIGPMNIPIYLRTSNMLLYQMNAKVHACICMLTSGGSLRMC